MTVVVDRKRWYLPDTVYVAPNRGFHYHWQFCRVLQYSRESYISTSVEAAQTEMMPLALSRGMSRLRWQPCQCIRSLQKRYGRCKTIEDAFRRYV